MMERQHVHATSNPTSWSQWGKAAFAFTVATGAYALSKAVGGVWGSEHISHVSNADQNNLPVVFVAPEVSYLTDAIHSTDARQGGHGEFYGSPLLILSTLAFSAPRYPLASLSTLGFLLIQQLDITQAAFPAAIDLANLTASQGCGMLGAAVGDQTGYSVSHAGDVNGDGLDDMLVGATNAGPLGRTDAGTAILLFGRNGSWPATLDLANLTATEGVVLQGAAVGDLTGVSVSHAGDVNGDGLDDVLVGAYLADPLSRSDAGTATLIFGQRDNTLTLPNTPSTPAASPVLSALVNPSSSSTSSISASNPASLPSMSSSPMATPTPSNAIPSSTPADSSNQMIAGFTLVSNSVLYAEIDIEVIITTENLSVEGFTGNPSQLIFTMNGGEGVTVLVNGEVSNQFTLFDLQSRYVDLLVDTAACGNDLSSVEVEASDGFSTVRSPLNLNVDYGSCIYNKASTLNAKSTLQGAAMLLVGSGFGIFASGQREKTNHKKTESNLLTNQNEGNLAMKLSV